MYDTNLYAVWGNPIAHSLSPKVHSLFAEQFGINIDYQLRGADVNLDDFYQHLMDFFTVEGALGCNITSPFKNVAFNLIESRTEACEIAGSCNTIKLLENGELLAHNTDGVGLYNDLQTRGWLTKDKQRILILGAGGAVSGVLFNLLQEGHLIDIYNRTPERAQDLAEKFIKYGSVKAVADYNLSEYDLVINAVPYRNDLDAVNIRTNSITNFTTKFYDMQYSTSGVTPFLTALRKLGVCPENIADGLGMLVLQAAYAFEFWFGRKPNTQSVIEELRASNNTIPN